MSGIIGPDHKLPGMLFLPMRGYEIGKQGPVRNTRRLFLPMRGYESLTCFMVSSFYFVISPHEGL